MVDISPHQEGVVSILAFDERAGSPLVTAYSPDAAVRVCRPSTGKLISLEAQLSLAFSRREKVVRSAG